MRYEEKCLHSRGGQALEQATQGSSGVTIPGNVQKISRQDTLSYGLVVTMVVMA